MTYIYDISQLSGLCISMLVFGQHLTFQMSGLFNAINKKQLCVLVVTEGQVLYWHGIGQFSSDAELAV